MNFFDRLQYLYENRDNMGLNDWEMEFVENVYENFFAKERELSPSQIRKINEIYEEKSYE